MKTIKYEINGTYIDIEVTDEFAMQYEQIEADENVSTERKRVGISHWRLLLKADSK